MMKFNFNKLLIMSSRFCAIIMASTLPLSAMDYSDDEKGGSSSLRSRSGNALTKQISALELYGRFAKASSGRSQLSISDRLSFCAESLPIVKVIESIFRDQNLLALWRSMHGMYIPWHLTQLLNAPLSTILFKRDKASPFGFTIESLDTLSQRLTGIHPRFEDSRSYIKGYPLHGEDPASWPLYQAIYRVVYSYIGYTPLSQTIKERIMSIGIMVPDVCGIIASYALSSAFQKQDEESSFPSLPSVSGVLSPSPEQPSRVHERAAIEFMALFEAFHTRLSSWQQALTVYERFATEKALLAQGRLEELVKDPTLHPSLAVVKATGEEWDTAKKELSLLKKFEKAIRQLGNRSGVIS